MIRPGLPGTLKLIAVADADIIGARDFLACCRGAQEGGATSVQIRMKGRPAREVYEMTDRIVTELEIPVFVNDRCDVAVAAAAHGVHLGYDDLAIPAARSIGGAAGLVMGTSVGNETEANGASAAAADYWGVGPVFETGNKVDAGAAIGLSGLARLSALADPTPVVGIGGIDAENCRDVLAAGAVGVAVIGAVFAAEHIETATRRLRAALDAG